MRRFWRWLKATAAWLLRPLHRRRPEPSQLPPGDDRLRAVLVEEQPDVLGAGACYLVGEGEHRWVAAFLCPCGCGDEVVLNLLPDMRPRWRIETHDDETVTIHPSINRHVRCRSHFFIRRGHPQWCDPEPKNTVLPAKDATSAAHQEKPRAPVTFR